MCEIQIPTARNRRPTAPFYLKPTPPLLHGRPIPIYLLLFICRSYDTPRLTVKSSWFGATLNGPEDL